MNPFFSIPGSRAENEIYDNVYEHDREHDYGKWYVDDMPVAEHPVGSGQEVLFPYERGLFLDQRQRLFNRPAIKAELFAAGTKLCGR